MDAIPKLNVVIVYLPIDLPKNITKCRQIYHSQSIWVLGMIRFHIYILYIYLLQVYQVCFWSQGAFRSPGIALVKQKIRISRLVGHALSNIARENQTLEFVDLVGGFNPFEKYTTVRMDHLHKCFKVNIHNTNK